MILFLIDKESILENSPKCIIKELFGFECISCGMTRAFINVSEFEFSEAYQMNKFSIPLFVLITLNFLTFLTTTFIHKNKP
jgi:hypothetical protein